MAGVVWVIGPDVLSVRGGTDAWAEGAVLLAALSYAVTAVFARRVGGLGLKPRDIATGQTTAGAIYLVPVALLFDRPWSLPVPSAPVIASVFAIAALCTALAYVVYFRILSGAGATNVLLVTLLAPATSVILGALILHERLLARQFLGFALIAIGLAFIDGRLPRALLAGNSNVGPHNSRTPHRPEIALACWPERALMATGTRKPIDLAERVASRRGKRSTAAAAEGGWRRETFCLPRDEARAKAREWFERFPKAAYMTEIESWRELAGDRIEFVIRRLPSAD